MRSFKAIAIGLAFAALALRALACSAVDPVPPNPHNHDQEDPAPLEYDGGVDDGGDQ